MAGGSEIVKFSMSGTAELEEMLERKPPEVAKKIVRTALRKAVGIWADEMRSTVRKGFHIFRAKTSHGKGRSRDYGVISRSIGVRVKLNNDEFGGTAEVGPTKAVYWSLFLEFGTKKMAAIPFIRRAYESRKADVHEKYIDVVRTMLKDEMGMR